jgi:hypothetical protein
MEMKLSYNLDYGIMWHTKGMYRCDMRISEVVKSIQDYFR